MAPRRQSPLTPDHHALLAELVGETRSVNQKLHYVLHDMPVNGEKGLERVLAQHHGDIKEVKTSVASLSTRSDEQGRTIVELMDITKTARSRRGLVRSFQMYLKDRPLIKALWMTVSSRRVLMFILGAIMTGLGVENAKAIIELAIKLWPF